MPLDQSLIDKLGVASLEAKSLLSEMHAAMKDLKRAVREAEEERDRVREVARETISEFFAENEIVELRAKLYDKYQEWVRLTELSQRSQEMMETIVARARRDIALLGEWVQEKVERGAHE